MIDMLIPLLTTSHRMVDSKPRTVLGLSCLHPNHDHLRLSVKVGPLSSLPALRALGLGCKPQGVRPYSIVP